MFRLTGVKAAHYLAHTHCKLRRFDLFWIRCRLFVQRVGRLKVRSHTDAAPRGTVRRSAVPHAVATLKFHGTFFLTKDPREDPRDELVP